MPMLLEMSKSLPIATVLAVGGSAAIVVGISIVLSKPLTCSLTGYSRYALVGAVVTFEGVNHTEVQPSSRRHAYHICLRLK